MLSRYAIKASSVGSASQGALTIGGFILQNAGIGGGRASEGAQLDSQTNIAIVNDLVYQRVAD